MAIRAMTALMVAQLAGAALLIVAAVVFIGAEIGRIRQARRRRIETWQKVVLFRQIVGGQGSFDALRLNYLASVRQFEQAVPISELEDATLQLLLMQLVADGLVMLTEGDEYVARRGAPALPKPGAGKPTQCLWRG
jgi:hypothetical protein